MLAPNQLAGARPPRTPRKETDVATVKMTKDNFEEIVKNNDTILVDFWAAWCGPCKAFAPTFEKASEAHPDIVFAKVDTDAEQELAAMFQIRSIPTLMVFREQIGIFSQPGALPASALDDIIGQVQKLDMNEVRKQLEDQEAKQASGNG